MERANNPYTPNAGAPPRYLAGRRAEVKDFRVLLKRLGRGYRLPVFHSGARASAWSLADGPGITEADAESARELVEAELDESFFRSRIQRSTVEERRYMRAMAELGSNAQKAADVAEVLGKASEQVAPLRARLINKGLLYTPRYGFAKFTAPQFDRFMRRHMALDPARVSEH